LPQSWTVHLSSEQAKVTVRWSGNAQIAKVAFRETRLKTYSKTERIETYEQQRQDIDTFLLEQTWREEFCRTCFSEQDTSHNVRLVDWC
jgi:hypothetical protein